MADARLRSTLAPWLADFALPGEPVDGSKVVVGCSGGPDSLALLALSCAAGLDVIAVHVDHGIRPGSERDAAVVEAAAGRLGAGFAQVRVEVEPGPGLEARAREARHRVLENQTTQHGASAVLLGHTSDDQAETVLLNIIRGAATTGVSGMPPVRGVFRRPLLGLSRTDTLEICARLRLAPVLDPMNEDLGFRRVWIRRELIPMIEAATGRDLRAVLARQADVMRAESEFLDAQGRQVLTAAGVSPGDPLPTAAFRDLDPVVARRALRVWLGAPPPSADEIERVLAVVSHDRRAAELGGSRRVERSGATMRVAPTTPERVAVELPGLGRFGTVRFESWVEAAAPARWPDGAWTCVLDADRVGPAGALVPVAHASGEPVAPAVALVDPAGTPLWEVGYRVATTARVTSATRRYLWARATLDEAERA